MPFAPFLCVSENLGHFPVWALHSPPDFRSKQLSFGATAWFNTNSHLCVSLTGRNSGNDPPHPSGPFTSLTLTKGSPPHLVTPPLVLLFADSSIRWASFLPMQPSAALLLPSQRIPVCQLCPAKGPQISLQVTWDGLLDPGSPESSLPCKQHRIQHIAEAAQS